MIILEEYLYISLVNFHEVKMTTKEKVKREIDQMPNDALEKVYKYISSLRKKTVQQKKVHTFNLKGQLDDVNIRERAYE